MLLLLLILFAVGIEGRSLLLLKCCPSQFVYNLTSKACQSVDDKLVIEWIPDQLRNQTLKSEFRVEVPELEAFDLQSGPCPSLLVNVSTPIIVSRSSVLELTAEPTASLKVDDRPLDQWCVDAALGGHPGGHASGGRRWVLLSCPCLHATCVCQCCLDGRRINIKKASAVSFLSYCPLSNASKWQPSVENLNLPANSLKPWYFRYMTVYDYTRNCVHSVLKGYSKTRRPKLIEDFRIDHRGILTSKRYTANSWGYCVGESVVGGEVKTVAMYCDRSEFVISFEAAGTQSALAAVGAFFSLLTLLVHVLSADLRRGIKGLSLMAHCTTMFAAYLMLAARPLTWAHRTNACTLLGIFTHFLLLSSFFWLNVRSIIIHATFRSLTSMLSGLSVSTKSFPLYALYAFGVPGAVSGFMAWAQFEDDKYLPDWITWPDIDEASCWFRKPLGRAIYYSLPMGILLVINGFLFVSTMVKINAFKKENQATLQSKDSGVLKENLKFDTQRLKLFANLSLLMGVTYLSEFFSWFNYLSPFYWYASNVAIAMRALLLFIVFCCKKKIWISLRRQYPRLDKAIAAVSSWFGHLMRRRNQYQAYEMSVHEEHTAHLNTKTTTAQISSSATSSSNAL